MNRRLAIKIVFIALIVFFLLILSSIFGLEFLHGKIFLPMISIFFLLSIALIWLTIKSKKDFKKWPKRFLLLTGFSAAGFFVCVILHNFFYALGILTENILILYYLMEALHVVFFIIGTILCPIGFIVGAVGSTILFVKHKKRKKK
jgi:hypothetical protein